jgi:FKBP-type peptidyl-prolyl cis-trans isomerase
VSLKFAMSCMTLGLALQGVTTFAQQTPTANQGREQPPTATVSQPAATPSGREPGAAAVNAGPTAAAGKEEPDKTTIQDRKDKISYAFGVDLGRDLRRQENDLNLDLLLSALKDALAGKQLLMTDEEVTATLKQVETEQKQDHEHAKAMISERNRREGEAFFSENAKKEGVVTLPSGLQYKILKKGDGKTPTLDDKVICQYRGTLVDGTELDSSYKRNLPATLPVKGIMAGWAQALQLMSVGSKWQIFIFPQLAYGEKIVGGIGPNAMLIFEVELLSIQEKPQTASAAR